MIPVEGSSRLIRWVVSMPPGDGSDRSIRMMSGEVSSARSIALRAILRLADDLEVGLATEDVGDADPEQGVVVDDEDPRRSRRASRRSGPPRRRSGPLYSIALIRSPLLPSAGPVGIASRTTVPPSGRDRTSNRAPISSARSRMNCSPKLRRPRAATAPTSNPRPSSRTSRTQSSSSTSVRRPRRMRRGVLADILQRLLGDAQGDRLLAVRRARRSGAVRSVVIVEAGQRPHVLDACPRSPRRGRAGRAAAGGAG